MKWLSVLLLFAAAPHYLRAQEPATIQAEAVAAREENMREEDTRELDWEQLRHHPLDINSAGEAELSATGLLTPLQVQQLLHYRNQFGKLVHLYELQAVPGWDLATIRSVLPYIRAGQPDSLLRSFIAAPEAGRHELLLRATINPGAIATADQYAGNPWHWMFRYKYKWKEQLQAGITGDKDPGEAFFRNKQRAGFDFYAAYLQVRTKGLLHTLVLGDYTINIGQGLIHRQGMSFGKSAVVTQIKAGGPLLRAHTAAGEYFFHRGAGVLLHYRKWQLCGFISLRKLSGSTVFDSTVHSLVLRSVNQSGLYRTQAELAQRNSFRQSMAGLSVRYQRGSLQVGLNAVAAAFSTPVHRNPEPYNRFAMQGRTWVNYSTDYSYTAGNLHVFGEIAACSGTALAQLHGLLITADKSVDVALLVRLLSPDYQSIFGNAFTENTLPSNEQGIYTGILVRPSAAWKLSAYADIFRFPWLRYRSDSPGGGTDFLLQVTYTPRRNAECTFRLHIEQKQQNGEGSLLHSQEMVVRKGMRLHLVHPFSKSLTLRSRCELSVYKRPDQLPETGLLLFTELLYKPMLSPLSLTGRLQFVSTQGYDARIYAYENDLPYKYSIPAAAGEFFRCYVLATVKMNRALRLSAKLGCAIAKGGTQTDIGLQTSLFW